jgi:ribose transport system ATP-binding protein
MAILIASSEMPELLALCHRVVVVREGSVVAEYEREEMNEEEIVSRAAGDTADV